MASYTFLETVTVVEVAQLGMDALGGYLADMGARVVKVEALPDGDPIRFAGDYAVGEPDGVGFLHLRWNRGKQSIGIDLRSERGKTLFKALVARADIVVEGLKGGAFDRMGLGYEVLRQGNPALVHCSISGLGRSGPYHGFRSHAVAYDAFAGLLPKQADAPPGHGEFKSPSIGMHAPGLYGAVGVLAALHRAQRTGEGAFLEIAAADAAANWVPDGLDAVVNAKVSEQRTGFNDATGRMRGWPRLWPYRTRDGRTLLLEALAGPTWRKFCDAVGREDLLKMHEQELDDDTYHRRLREEIADILRERDLADWMALFSAKDISAMPVNDLEELSRDEHYLARQLWYERQVPGIGTLRLSGTPVKVDGEEFSPALAPMLGQHSDRILEDLLALGDDEISALRAEKVIG